jgi:PAS domain-containing protein
MTSNDRRVMSAGDSEPSSDCAGQGEQLAYLAAVVAAASSDAIVSKGMDGTITSSNANSGRIFGFAAEEMVGENIRRLIPEELQAEEDEIRALITETAEALLGGGLSREGP